MVPSAPLGDLELRIQNGRVKVFRPDLDAMQPLAELVLDFQLQGRDPERFTAIRLELAENGFDLHTELWDILSLDIRLESRPELNGVGMKLRLINPAETMRCRVGVGLRQLAGEAPRWMIPGIFYKDNRVEECRRIYPSYSPDNPDPQRMVSNAWSFRSDRAATPGVFVWTSKVGAYVLTNERAGVTDQNRAGVGMTGLYFRSDRGAPEIGMQLPYTETPIQYSYCHAERTAPVETWMDAATNVVVDWEVFFGLGASAIHSYDPVLRAYGKQAAASNPIRPWLSGEEAEALAVDGLMMWHAAPDKDLLYETAVFDKYFGKMGGYVDRPVMHTGWSGGAPIAYALLLRGYEQKDDALIEMGRAILTLISEAQTPLGTFWPELDAEAGWTTGMNPKETWIQARTLADATLFMVRSLRLQVKQGNTHFSWLQAIQGNLEFALKVQREDGCFGSCYDVETGEVAEWEGCAGLAWIGAMVAGCSLLYDPRFREAARRAGAYYARFVEDEFIYGATEDQFLTPTVEDGYCAVTAYLLLYELDRSERWLRLARRAADWALTFRFTYNVTFAKHSLLGVVDYRTRGADVSSPANHAIHNYGLWAYPEMVKLSNLTNDPYYAERAEEQRLSCLQLIAREDGDFGARRGMAPDQIYQTDWWQPKGRVLSVSSASTLAAVLYANAASRMALNEPIVDAPAKDPDKSGGQDTETAPDSPKPPKEIRPSLRPHERPWAPTDPRETQDIPVKWKIF